MSINILAIDTSSPACSVALLTNGEIVEKFQIVERQHNALILPMIEQVLAEAGLGKNQLNAMAFGRGPGSFTGLRIAASVVQAIAFALEIPVIPVSTLQALAQGAYREFAVTDVIAVIDARINEIYWSAYGCDQNNLMQPINDEMVCAPSDIGRLPLTKQWYGIGSGWDAYHSQLALLFDPQLIQWFPNGNVKASDIVKLAENEYQYNRVVAAQQALPIYLRDQVVKARPHE